MRTTLVTVAPQTSIITKTGFSNYDVCLNSYVGCEFACEYCYVRFFIKDEKREWGDFVRVRHHLADNLPKELKKGTVKTSDGREPAYNKDGTPKLDENGRHATKPRHQTRAINDLRLVLGTMTDPYQPVEAKYRITRTALQILTDQTNPQFKKVGIFTRSPLVLQDIDLIKKLPNPRIHFTVTPFPDEVTRVIEPKTAPAERRWQIIEKLLDAGIRVHVNIAPIMPILSEPLLEKWAERISKLPVAEYFVDPMQPYKESFQAFERACSKIPDLDWNKIKTIMTDKDKYLDWKTDYRKRWETERNKHAHHNPQTLPIWCDHEYKTWIDMRTNTQMDNRNYGDEAK